MTVAQLWAGVDVGKEHHWVVVVDDKGKVVLSRKLVNDEQSIRALVAEVGALAERVSWAVDLTTVYASLLLMVLADAGTSVRYLAGRAVWQASGTYRGGEAKTDAKDARVIADQSRMRGADLPVLHPHDDLITELRMLTAHRADLVADRTRTINRLRQQLMAVCPALERVAQPSQDRGWVVLLSRYQRPKAIRQSGLSRITKTLADAGVRNASTIAQAAVAAAKTQTVRLPGEEVAAALVAELAQGVISLDDRITATDADIEGRFRRHPLAEVITSIPGIGFRLGAEFLAAVGDPTLIGSADHLAAWAGLAPVPRDSGKRTGRLHTPQRYSRRLRRAAVSELAMGQVHTPPGLGQLHDGVLLPVQQRVQRLPWWRARRGVGQITTGGHLSGPRQHPGVIQAQLPAGPPPGEPVGARAWSTSSSSPCLAGPATRAGTRPAFSPNRLFPFPGAS